MGDSFMRAMQAKRSGGFPPAKPKPPKFAEGGEAGMEPEAPEGAVSDEEKFAASEIQSALTDSDPGRLALALKSFFLLVDAQPHDEGGMEMGEGEETGFPSP